MSVVIVIVAEADRKHQPGLDKQLFSGRRAVAESRLCYFRVCLWLVEYLLDRSGLASKLVAHAARYTHRC